MPLSSAVFSNRVDGQTEIPMVLTRGETQESLDRQCRQF